MNGNWHASGLMVAPGPHRMALISWMTGHRLPKFGDVLHTATTQMSDELMMVMFIQCCKELMWKEDVLLGIDNLFSWLQHVDLDRLQHMLDVAFLEFPNQFFVRVARKFP